MSTETDELEVSRRRIFALQDGAMRAQALAFCLRSGLFDRLSESPATPEELGLAPRIAPTLLAFLSSQDLVARDLQGRFHTTPASDAFLTQSSPRFIGGRSLLFQGRHRQIGRLGEVLATGRPLTETELDDSFENFSTGDQKWFAEGMLANAVSGARYLQQELDFSPFRRLLDVGGNTGGYALALLKAYPLLEATIFDLEQVRPLAEKRIAELQLRDRCQFQSGSFFENALPNGHDIFLLANILHDWDTSRCERILSACREAIEPGGKVVVVEPMLHEDLTGPAHASVSGLTMALLGGENRTQSSIADLLERAGFVEVWQSRTGEQNSVVTARKAGN